MNNSIKMINRERGFVKTVWLQAFLLYCIRNERNNDVLLKNASASHSEHDFERVLGGTMDFVGITGSLCPHCFSSSFHTLIVVNHVDLYVRRYG